MPKIIVNGMHMGYVAPSRAQDVSYDNTTSGLTSTDIKSAIDEINNKFTNQVTSKTAAGLCPQLPNEDTTTKYLRQDGTWVVPPNDNTLYPKAIKNITRNGTTFTATCYDDTTFTFTQQDNDTTYSAGTGIGLSGTSFYLPIPRVAESCNALPGAASLRFREYTGGANYNLPSNAWYQILEIRSEDTNYGTQLALGMTTDAAYYRKYSGGSWGSWKSLIDTNTTYSAGSNITLSGTTFSLTKANVTGALGYTPPTSDTNTVTSFTTKEFENTFSVSANSTASLYPTITNSGWTPLGVIGVYTGSEVCFCPYWKLNSSTQARIEIRNSSNMAVTNGKYRVQILYYKNT